MNERVLAYQFFNLYLYIKHRVLLITFLPNDLDFYQGPVHYSTVATTNTVPVPVPGTRRQARFFSLCYTVCTVCLGKTK